MTAKQAVILSIGAALALSAQPVMASSRGSGGHSGGGHAVARSGGGGHAVAHNSGGYRGGGSHAVPRGGGGRAPVYGGGGVAAARQPRPGGYYYGHGGGYYGHGGGSYYGHGGGYYGHGGGYYGHGGGYYGHGGGYYGHGSRYYGYGHYYGGYYYPYYYPYLSFSFGWPYYGGYWGGYSYPYYYPYYDGTYDYGYQSAPPPPEDNGAYGENPPAARPQDSDTGRLQLDVRPPDASVYVDGEFWGNARDAQSLILRSGRHSIEVVRPGFEVARREVDVVRGQTTDLAVELQRR